MNPIFTTEDIATLMKFYSVNTLDDLVKAQAEHVERLQAKLLVFEKTQPALGFRGRG